MTGTSKSIEQVLHIKPTISSEMINAIELWGDMYQNKAPWLKEGTPENPERVTSLGIPAFIASEKARMCTLEMKSEITPVMEATEATEPNTGLNIEQEAPTGDTARADFLNEQYKKTIFKDIRTQLEYGIAKGGLVIKPYIVNSNVEGEQAAEIAMDYIQADGFYPIAFNASGKITEAAFVQKIIDKENTYSRLEYHKLEGSTVTVINKAYKSYNSGSQSLQSNELGSEVPLSSIPEWASLEPETKITNVDSLLFAYFKPPIANTVDTYSPLGVSVYSRAVNLIRDADEQYSRILWEYEGSELAIDIDRDALTLERDKDGRDITVHSKKQNRLYRKVDMNDESTYNVFSPQIRDTSLFNGLNNILMRIEDTCELARGTIADVNVEARTATEITVLKQRSYAANAQMQLQLENTLKDVIHIMDVYTSLYELAPEGEYNVSFEWDDSIKVDKESEMNKRLTLVNAGIDSKVSFRMWYFGETEEQALQALAKNQAYNNYEAQNAMENQMIANGEE